MHRIPDGISFDEACCLLANYETAYHCLIACAQLRPGESVLINGASGATGMAAVQAAKLVGATVIATGRSDAKLALVKAHGADHVINSHRRRTRRALLSRRGEGAHRRTGGGRGL